MMKTILIAAATILQAYLLGSVDAGILISKFVYHDDVRKHGSGAAGMTNMLRTFGKKAAAMTAAVDVLKGVAAVCIGRWMFHLLPADAGVSPYLGVYLAAILYGVIRGYAAGDMLVCAIGSGFMSGMVIYMHRANIQRIREGKEYRFGKHNKK